MQILEKRSQRRGRNRALAGRKKTEHLDDTEMLTTRQATKLCRVYPVSLEVAITLARLAYAARS
jgi:hypothetical protein